MKKMLLVGLVGALCVSQDAVAGASKKTGTRNVASGPTQVNIPQSPVITLSDFVNPKLYNEYQQQYELWKKQMASLQEKQESLITSFFNKKTFELKDKNLLANDSMMTTIPKNLAAGKAFQAEQAAISREGENLMKKYQNSRTGEWSSKDAQNKYNALGEQYKALQEKYCIQVSYFIAYPSNPIK